MSANNGNGQQKQAQAALPEPQQAYDHLFQNVHANVFFQKLASHGIQPSNEKEAQDLLGLAAKLRIANDNPQVQQKAAGDSLFAQASSDLDSVLSDRGIDTGIKSAEAQEAEIAVKQAAQQLAQDPSIYNSVLSLKAAEAATLTEQMTSRAG